MEKKKIEEKVSRKIEEVMKIPREQVRDQRAKDIEKLDLLINKQVTDALQKME